MKKIFQLIVSIPHDKLLHIIAGMIVVMLVLRLVSFIGIPGMDCTYYCIDSSNFNRGIA